MALSEFVYEYQAVLLRVVDGDTVDVLIDLGFDIWHKARIRLQGIDTPETRTRDFEEKQAGMAAKARLEDLLPEPKGEPFVLESQIYYGKYGRVLGVLFVDGKNINQQLLDEGHALPYELK
jgi:micrococcal nuclease